MLKWLRRIGIALVAIMAAAAAIVLFIDRFVVISVKSRIVKSDEAPDATAILVLGASVFGNGQVSDILKDRLDTALELYRDKKASRILVSGDHGNVDYDEVGTMKRYLTDRKVPASAIFMDHAGFSTYESMYRAKAVFDVDRVIIVTQQYHVSRAVFVGRSLGLDAYGVAADKRAYRDMDKYRLREVLARNKDFFLSRIWKPEPPDLGDKIPITGDGRVTAKP
ncbi:vancomycin high temperature exclusion protein [Paenibacillus sp. YN15]|uniref:SanA/YdcF family protein n=1 Tax=Paenibacillus sp. YN15 TaxID=1742774 RepID=UPI000DCCF0A7|nr:ElyC/SanA/YdcF family protein [Paenibacillus sp. YN15]RAV05656.1 hypothetical protein DQG13_03300 [Paenibacillus sp. YN15]